MKTRDSHLALPIEHVSNDMSNFKIIIVTNVKM